MTLEKNLLLLISDSNLGNCYYHAPEMNHANSEINEKVDIFILGIILFAMLCHFKTLMEIYKFIKDLKEKNQFPKTCPENVDQDFILGLISNEPRARPSVAEILNSHP